VAAVAATAAVALAAACTSTGVDAQTSAVRDTSNGTLKAACTSSTCSGTRSGGAFVIQLPDKSNWNGTLLLWSHGYRAAAPVPSNPLNPTALTPVDRSAQDAPNTDVAKALLTQGYALAGSAAGSNGWDTLDGVRAAEDLYSYFNTTFGTPNRVYLWGQSLGGLTTEMLAETHQSWVSGVAPMCGPIAGTNRNFDLALDVAYAVKTLVAPKLQLTGFSSVNQAVDQWNYATNALIKAAQKADLADLFAIAAIAGVPAPPRTDMFDGSKLDSQVQAVVQSIVQAVQTNTYIRYDLEQRVGGNPSQNTGVDYAARIGNNFQALIPAQQLHKITDKLAAGTRVSADPAARAKANTLGNPDGSIQRPTITLHTEADSVDIVQNENVFGNQVAAHSDGGQLIQLYTGPPNTYSSAPYGAGNCNFTNLEFEGVVQMLDNWARYAVYAGPGSAGQAFDYTVDSTDASKNNPKKIAAGTATTGYDPNFAAPPWPASATG
jgi:pimeloyl-ACP methyl ester carboxylesterase